MTTIEPTINEREASRNGDGRRRSIAHEAGALTRLSSAIVAFNVGYLALAWLVAAGAIALFWAHPAWYTFALAFVVVSSRQQALLNCEHEAVHRKFLPNRRVNEAVGRYLCAAPVGSPFGAARARHLSHHQLLGSPDDPDRELHQGEDKESRRGLARYFIGGLLGGYAGMILMGPRARPEPGSSSAVRDLISLVVVQGAIAVTLTLTTAWWVYPALWLVPLASVTAFCHLLRSFVEHAITDSETAVHSNRLITIRSNLLERALVSPYYMNYHAEHHILPAVPAPRLGELQHRLTSRPDAPTVLVRPSYGSAIRTYLRGLSR
jgi:fatty acid desaturase